MIDLALYDNGSGGRTVDTKYGPDYTKSLYTEIYIALFGGNTTKEWWGNRTERTDRWVASETEKLIIGATITPELISKIESAVKEDLKVIEKYGTVEIDVSVKGINRIEIYVYVQGTEYEFLWDSTLNEIITNETL